MRRNVILIYTDQWRGDAFSIEGHPTVRTPYLDEFADRGARARRAYSGSPTCVPARMTLFTSLVAAHHGRVGYQDGVPFDVETTLAGEFKKAGYHTQAIGKMHLWPERVRAGFDDVILHDGYLHKSRRREQSTEWYDDYLSWLREQDGESAVADYLDDGLHCNSMVARPWSRPEAYHPTSWAVTKAIEWLYRRDPTVPFFLYLSFHRPHSPFDPPQWAFDQYMNMPSHEVPVGDWVDEFEPWRNDKRPDSLVAVYPEYDQHRAQAGYYGNMSHIDAQLERFFEVLGEFGLTQDTYVAFSSDHGEMLGDHHMWRKGYPYEGSAHIPFFIKGPGIPEHSTIDEVIEIRDWMPTLLECAGIDIPEGLDGRSVLPLIHGPNGEKVELPADQPRSQGTTGDEWREFTHGEHILNDVSMQFVLSQRFKYIWLHHNGHEQLFDIPNDPQELHNLAGDPNYGAELARHRQFLIECLEGREEGFVEDGHLVPGREVHTTLSFAGKNPVAVEHPKPQMGVAAP